jgi:putative MATE family efflux protein
MTFGVGSGSYVARLLGRKELVKANQAASTAFFVALAFGLVIMLAGLLATDELMHLLGSTTTILPYARSYARIILLGAPFLAASFVMNVNLRSEGSAALAMIGLASGAVLNIVLDPIFIFVLNMGVAGAALATVISQITSFLILVSHYIGKRSTLTIAARYIHLKWRLLWEILQSGLPTFSRLALATLAVIALNMSARKFGDAAIAGMTVVNRIMMLINSALIGFGQGFQPVAAFNYSAGFYRRVYKAFWFAVKVGTLVLVAGTLIAMIFAPQIIKLFRDDPEVVVVGALALRLQCATMPLNAFFSISNMMFQYIGKPWRATTLAIVRQGLFFIPILMTMVYFFGLKGIQASQSVADIMSFTTAVILTYGTLRTLRHSEK